MHFTLSGRSSGKGGAQVDTALLEDMHREAEKAEKQKARGYWVGAGVDVLQQMALQAKCGR